VRLKYIAISLFLILLLPVSTISSANAVANDTKIITSSNNNVTFSSESIMDADNHYRVIILYDKYNEIIQYSAYKILFVLRLAYPYVDIKKIDSLYEIETTLNTGDYRVAIIYLNSTYDSVLLGDWEYSWEDFGGMLSRIDDVDIVLCTGNTYRLDKWRKSLWHYDDYEYTTPTGIEVFAVWETARIFKTFGEEYDDISREMEQRSIEYFVQNMKQLFHDNVAPEVKIGTVDPDLSELRKKAWLSKHPPSFQISKSAINETVMDSPAIFALKNVTTEADDDIDFMKIPIFSGLKGPAGDFVDKVLNFLVNYVSDTLSIDTSFVNDFVNLFKLLSEFIGDPSKLGEGSLLKSFLDTLKNEFPFLENYTKYFDLFIDGFYALKGDLSSILNFIQSAIEALFPETGATIDMLKDILKTILSISSDVMDLVGYVTDNKISLILNWMTTKLANLSIMSLLKEIPGISDVTDLYNNITSIIKIATDILTVDNITDFADKLFDVVVNKLKIVTDLEIIDVMEKVKSTLALILVFVEKKEDFSIKALLEEVIKSYIDTSYITDLENMVKEIMDEIDEAIKEAKSDLNTFKSTIEGIINKYTTSDPTMNTAKQLILKIITLVSTIANPSFDIQQVDSVISIIDDIINLFLDEPIEIKEKVFLIINATILPFGLLADSSRVLKAFFKKVDFLMDVKQDLLELFVDLVKMIIQQNFPSINIDDILEQIEAGMKIIRGLIDVIGKVKERPFDGVFTVLMFGASYALKELFPELSIGNITKILEVLLPDVMGLIKTPSVDEAIKTVTEALNALASNSTIVDTITQVLMFLLNIRDVLRDGVKWLTNKILDWISGKITEFISKFTSKLENLINNFAFLDVSGELPISLGGLDLLSFGYSIAIKANFDINEKELVNDFKDIVLKGKYLDLLNPIETFWKVIKRITIIPTFEAGFKLKSVFSDDNKLLQKAIESLGVTINVEGEARFKLQLLAFKSGSFDLSEFTKLLEWYMRFKLETSRTFTIFDLIGASTLGSIAEEIGLDGITVTLTLGLQIEINIGSTSSDGGEQSTLTVELTIAGTLHIGFDIAIAAVTLDFTLTITFRFSLDMTHSVSLTFTVSVSYLLKIHLKFLFVGKTYKFGGTIYSYTFPKPGEKESDFTGGFDTDGDGLSDDFENRSFGFAPNRTDTDLDGIPDNVELNGFGTDPLDPDTDGDGLTDYEELYETHTDPLNRDSDNDRLNDYVEARVYGTNPNEVDTDGDGLDDYFEVNYAWDIEAVTISITGVQIGGKTYYDHTDPLNPDTDGDGLLDGQEGPMGGYYGDVLKSFGDNPIIFNYGYTHPLDNDTDDDSYLQMYDGRIMEPKTFLMSMTDKDEIDGITAIFIEDGEPVLKTFRTSPVCPDTDQDTGSGAVILNSDSYELSLTPPTNPLNGDSDGDGLKDGDEGVTSPFSNKTDPLNPDTDSDGLGDLQEILMGLDPANPDSDFDMVSDGDEVLKYGTNPRMADSDFDGLTDGEELYYFHCNPMIKDSDTDGLTDGKEVLVYFTNPMDEDTDNDNLTDLDEVMYHHTNPFEPDSDYDGILDGEEVYLYKTDPLNWDTDNDSIIYPNEYGEMTWPMSDGMEVFIYGTDPLRTDTDNDGISDSLELYLSSGKIPNFEPINLDPLNNDTDGDGLMDGVELRIKNVSDIVYPYVSYNLSYPHGCIPISNDTDGDGISDYDEVMIYATMPDNNDTDNDNLTDYEEIFVYNTSPIFNDTDFDNLSDWQEIIGVNLTLNAAALYKLIKLDPSDPDTDNDLLPDGYEVQVVHTDPTNPDSDGDGVLDGYEFDTDDDGLSDGEEFFIYGTPYYGGGGPYNPDSDRDGLSDGIEVHIYGTDPANPDTDGDGFSDGAEVAVGTDPLTPTSYAEYLAALRQLLGDKLIKVLSPVGRIIDKYEDVRVINGTNVESMWFRFVKDDQYSDNYTMVYDSDNMQWVYDNITWERGTYRLEVFAKLPNDAVIYTVVTFEFEPVPQPNVWLWLAIGIASGFALALFVIMILPKILEARKARKNTPVETPMNEEVDVNE